MIYKDLIINSIKQLLVEKKLTLAVAESVTAGHLQAAFSSAIEASKFFQGGITAYNLGQKSRHLNIDPINAQQDDCVNEIIACKMATEANRMFLSDYGIAITGYATKMPEKNLNELFAFFAIAFHDKIVITRRIQCNKENTVEAQIDYTNQVIIEFEKIADEAHMK